jgi:archaellum component FlaG (FlaF/FlaG flagellin family)
MNDTIQDTFFIYKNNYSITYINKLNKRASHAFEFAIQNTGKNSFSNLKVPYTVLLDGVVYTRDTVTLNLKSLESTKITLKDSIIYYTGKYHKVAIQLDNSLDNYSADNNSGFDLYENSKDYKIKVLSYTTSNKVLTVNYELTNISSSATVNETIKIDATLNSTSMGSQSITSSLGPGQSKQYSLTYNYGLTNIKGQVISVTHNLSGDQDITDNKDTATILNYTDILENGLTSISLKLYPNPTNNGIITVSNDINVALGQMDVLALDGRVISSTYSNNSLEELKLNEFSKGTYFIVLRKFNQVRKIVLQ